MPIFKIISITKLHLGSKNWRHIIFVPILCYKSWNKVCFSWCCQTILKSGRGGWEAWLFASRNTCYYKIKPNKLSSWLIRIAVCLSIIILNSYFGVPMVSKLLCYIRYFLVFQDSYSGILSENDPTQALIWNIPSSKFLL